MDKITINNSVETISILRKVNLANKKLAELKGIVKTIPNENVLINFIFLSEAKDSSAVENIITTHDELFKQFIFDEPQNTAAKEVENYVDLGSHGMFICKVTEARVMSDKETMTYTYYQDHVKPKPNTEGKKGWVCKICGYIYEGDTLPDDYICPLCKHGVADFEPIEN